jgi:hypothetical protein
MGPPLKTSPKRIGHTYKYYVTAFGESVLLVGLKVKELALINLLRGRSHRGELHHGSNRTEAPIGFKGSPLAQMRWVGKRLPHFFRRVAQFSDENERPLLSVLSYLGPAGRTRCVLLAISHLLLLVFLFVGVD